MASTSSTQSPLLVPRGAREGKPAIPINRPVWIIGSRKGCHLQLQSEHVSQAHAVIINTGRGLFIKDLASRTHTYVNRLPVKEVHLKEGDKVQIGPFKFYFQDPTANPGDKPPVAPAANLRVVGEPIPLPLEDRVTMIGRRSSADIHLTEESVSTTHALIIDIDGEHYIRDLGSRTGTFLNGEKINRQAPLSAGDKLQIGDTVMTYETVVAEPEPEVEESAAFEGSRLAMSLDESAAPIEATPAPAAEQESAAPLADADLDDLLGLAPTKSDADEPLPLEELTPEPPAVEEPEAPAEIEVSATAAPVVEPPAASEVEPEPVVEEPEAEAPAEEEPAEPAPSSSRARRGWKLWGTRQPAKAEPPKAEAPIAPLAVSNVEPPAVSNVEPPAVSNVEPPAVSNVEPPPVAEAPKLSEPLELSEPLGVSGADELDSSPPVVDLTPPAEPAALPTVDLSDELPSVEELSELAPPEPEAEAPASEPAPADEVVLPLEPEDPDASDTAYAVELSPSASESAATEAAREEVTSGDLELSAVEESPALDLESAAEQETAVATATEPAADDVFEGVDLDALALDALNEPEKTEEVSATLDQEAAAEGVADSSTTLSEPEPVVDESTTPDTVEPEAPTAPVEEPAAIEELPTVEDEKTIADEPLTMADEGSPEAPPAPATPAAPVGKGDDLPPPLNTPVKLKPSTRRRKRGDDETPPPRRRGPIRGPGGKFISATEAEQLALGGTLGEAEGLSEIEAPDQGLTTDLGSEVLESTEPTPESALSLEPVTPAVADEIPLPAEEPVPSDSVFGRAVEDMGGSIAGELVEPSAEPVPAEEAPKALSPLEQIAADATHFVDTDEPTPSHVTVADEVHHPEPTAEIIEHEEIVAEAAEVEEPAPLDLTEEPGPLEPAAPEEPEATLELSAEEPIGEAPLELPAIGEEPVTLQLNGDPEETQLTLGEPEATVEQEATIEPSPLELPAGEAAAELPSESDLEAPASELELPAPSDVKTPAVSEIEPPVVSEVEPPQELSFDETFEPTEATTLAGDAIVAEPSATDSETAETTEFVPQPEAELPPEPEAPQPPPGAPNLGFFGIARDADTFLGGMPLSLPPLPPPPPTFGKVGLSFGDSQKGNPHAAPLPPPLIIGHDDEDDDGTPTAEAPAEDEAPPELPADYTATGAPIQEPDAGSTDSIPALPVQETSATTDAPKMPVPPRPRRNRLADYEKRFAKVDEDAAIEAMQRELNKPRPEQAAPSGFDGLTMGPAVRQTDVFSDAPSDPLGGAMAPRPNDPFLADKQASIDLAARSVATGHIPPMPQGLTSAGGAPPLAPEPPPISDADPFGLPPVARKADLPSDRIDRHDRTPPRMTARPAPAPDFNYTGPQRGGRKIPIRVLVAAMVVFMIGAGVAGFMLTPIYTTLQARATFANLKDKTDFEQHRFRTEQQAVLVSEVVRNTAKAKLNEEHPSVDTGLLTDPLAFDALARDLEWPPKTNEVRLKLKSVDPAGDKLRLMALLQALYNENKHLGDVASQKKGEFEKAQAELDQLNVQLKDLQARIRDVQNSASEAPGASLISAVEQEAASLRGQMDEAGAKVSKLKFELERLAPGGVMPQLEQNGENVPAVDNIAGGDPEKDPVVVTTREQLKALQDEITRLKAATSEDAADNARKALDNTIRSFQQELAKLQDGKGAEWQDFLAKAKKLQGMAEMLTGEVIQKQRDEQNALAELKRKLEQELAERREKRFQSSVELKKEIDANRMANRQHNVAAAENLNAEAERYRGMIEQTEARIASIKTELSKDPEKEAEIAKVQKLIDDGKASISGDRKALDARMQETLKEFLAAGRQLYQKLNEADKKAAESLAARAGEMVEANQVYANLVNSIKDGATDELRKKEADAQQLAAALDRRIAQVKDADRKNKSDLEKQAAIQQIEKAKTDLAAAEVAQKAASDKWVAKQQELADLRAKAGLAKAADDKLQENIKAREALQATITTKIRELDDKRKTGLASVVPEPIADDAVTEGPRQDDRWKYALIASAGVCALFLVLIWLGGYHQAPQPGHRPVIETAAAPTTERAGDEETLAV